MEFFTLQNSSDEDIVGCVPQTKGMSIEYNLRNDSSVWNIRNFCESTIVPDLDYFELYKGTKLTDVINTGLINASGFLISENLYSTLNKLNLPRHKYYQGRVKFGEDFYNYGWLHFLEDFINYIDFGMSVFELKHPLPWKNDSPIEIQVADNNELIEFWRANCEIKKIFPKKLVLNTYSRKFDLFSFSIFWKNIIVNKTLKDLIETNNISGFQLSPISFDFVLK